jgi:hypothetical protein
MLIVVFFGNIGNIFVNVFREKIAVYSENNRKQTRTLNEMQSYGMLKCVVHSNQR